jgi:hypothetical protein
MKPLSILSADEKIEDPVVQKQNKPQSLLRELPGLCST